MAPSLQPLPLAAILICFLIPFIHKQGNVLIEAYCSLLFTADWYILLSFLYFFLLYQHNILPIYSVSMLIFSACIFVKNNERAFSFQISSHFWCTVFEQYTNYWHMYIIRTTLCCSDFYFHTIVWVFLLSLLSFFHILSVRCAYNIYFQIVCAKGLL